MKKILKLFDESKTLQIILDKCIIGIFILLAAFLINKNLENAKTKNKIEMIPIYYSLFSTFIFFKISKRQAE